jgi:hypothetical protein
MAGFLDMLSGGADKPEVSRRKQIEQSASEALIGTLQRVARGEAIATVGVQPQATKTQLGLGAILAIAAVGYVVVQALGLKKR